MFASVIWIHESNLKRHKLCFVYAVMQYRTKMLSVMRCTVSDVKCLNFHITTPFISTQSNRQYICSQNASALVHTSTFCVLYFSKIKIEMVKSLQMSTNAKNNLHLLSYSNLFSHDMPLKEKNSNINNVLQYIT